MDDSRSQPRSGTSAPDADFYDVSGMEGLRGLEGQAVRAADAEPLGMVALGTESRPGKLSHYTLTAIETQAQAAAKEGRAPVDACSWPFGSREGTHWLSVYLLAGGAL